MTEPSAGHSKFLEGAAAKVLAGVLTAIVLGGLGQGLAIYTWVKVAEEQLKQVSGDVREIKADLKEATRDRYARTDAQEDHRVLWRAMREHKHP